MKQAHYYFQRSSVEIKIPEFQNMIRGRHQLDQIYEQMPDVFFSDLKKSAELDVFIPSDGSYVVMISHQYEQAMGLYLGVVSLVKEGRFFFGKPWRKISEKDNICEPIIPLVYRHGVYIDETKGNNYVWFKAGARFVVLDVEKGLFCEDCPFGYTNKDFSDDERRIRIAEVSGYDLEHKKPTVSPNVTWFPIAGKAA